jgi:amino acid permease
MKREQQLDVDSDGSDHEVVDGDISTTIEVKEPIEQPEQWLNGVPAAVFNLVNSTIGAGVLGLPYMMAQSGLALGLIVILVFAALANYTLRLLHQTSLTTREHTYEDIAHGLYGRWAALAVKVAVIAINFGAMISYMIVIADFLQPVMRLWFGDDSLFENRTFIIGWITLLVLLPLSLSKHIASLKYTSLLSIAMIAVFAITVVVRCFAPEWHRYGGELVWFNWSFQIFQGIGLVIFAFAAHTNLVPVAVEMRQYNSRANMTRAVHTTSALCFAAYGIVGVFGYLTFYEHTQGNILNNYPDGDVLVDVMRVLLTVAIVLTFPLAAYPCRLSLDRLLFPSAQPHGYDDLDGATQPLIEAEHPPPPPPPSSSSSALAKSGRPADIVMIGYVPVHRSFFRFLAETLGLLALAFLVAIFVPNVEIVFSLIGSTASACTSYIFPALLWQRAKSSMDSTTLGFRVNRVLTPLVGVAGVVLGCFGLTMNILDIVDGDL